MKKAATLYMPQNSAIDVDDRHMDAEPLLAQALPTVKPQYPTKRGTPHGIRQQHGGAPTNNIMAQIVKAYKTT